MTSGSPFKLNRLSASSSVNWRMTSRGVVATMRVSRSVMDHEYADRKAAAEGTNEERKATPTMGNNEELRAVISYERLIRRILSPRSFPRYPARRRGRA